MPSKAFQWQVGAGRSMNISDISPTLDKSKVVAVYRDSSTLTKNISGVTTSDLVCFHARHYTHGVGSGNHGNQSFTLLSRKSGGGFADYPHIAYRGGVRRLTPTECERLQGFPDGWTDHQSDKKRYEQLGDSIAVPVAEWLARRIVALDGGS